MTQHWQLAILGAGVMGETVLSGLIRAGWSPDKITVTDRRPERQIELQQKYGVVVLENPEAAASADTVILVVKPQDMNDLLTEIAGSLRPGTLVVSLAAGVDTAAMEAQLPGGTPVVRVMPNTPVQLRQGVCCIAEGGEAAVPLFERVVKYSCCRNRR